MIICYLGKRAPLTRFGLAEQKSGKVITKAAHVKAAEA
jgi:hypothetical protein